jgi:hypothetical protein
MNVHKNVNMPIILTPLLFFFTTLKIAQVDSLAATCENIVDACIYSCAHPTAQRNENIQIHETRNVVDCTDHILLF